MNCPSCGREMDKATVRYHTPLGYERKMVVYECAYDSCSGQDFTEDEIENATLRAERDEAVRLLKVVEFLPDDEGIEECPFCLFIKPGHYEDCDLANLLAKVKP